MDYQEVPHEFITDSHEQNTLDYQINLSNIKSLSSKPMATSPTTSTPSTISNSPPSMPPTQIQTTTLPTNASSTTLSLSEHTTADFIQYRVNEINGLMNMLLSTEGVDYYNDEKIMNSPSNFRKFKRQVMKSIQSFRFVDRENIKIKINLLMMGPCSVGKTTWASLLRSLIECRKYVVLNPDVSNDATVNGTKYFTTIVKLLWIHYLMISITDAPGITMDSISNKYIEYISDLFSQGRRPTPIPHEWVGKDRVLPGFKINKIEDQYNLGMFFLRYHPDYFFTRDGELVFNTDHIDVRPTTILLKELVEKKDSQTTIIINRLSKVNNVNPEEIRQAVSRSFVKGKVNVIVDLIDSTFDDHHPERITPAHELMVLYTFFHLLRQETSNHTIPITLKDRLRGSSNILFQICMVVLFASILISLYLK